MKVICNGFRDCKYNDRCRHSKEHELDLNINTTTCSYMKI